MLKALLRVGGITLAGYVVVALVGVVSVRVYTELARPEIFGAGNLALTTVTLAITLLVAPITNTQIRFHTEAVERGRSAAFTFETLKWSLASALAILVLGGAAYAVLAARGAAPVGWPGLIACEALVLLLVLRNVFMNQLQAERLQVRYTIALVAEAVAVLVFASLALRLSKTPDAYLGGHAVGTAAVLILALLFSPIPPRNLLTPAARSPEEARAFAGRVKVYGGPFVPFGLLNWLSNLSERYVLAGVLGVGAVGQYVAPFGIASRAMNLANGALGDIFRPRLFDAENRGAHAEADKLFLWWVIARVVAAVGGVIALALAGPLITRLLLASDYRAYAVAVMVWVSAGYGVYGLTMTLENRLMSLDRTALLLPPLLVGAGANLGFSLWLVPLNGVVGAGQATCASFLAQCVATALMLIWARRRPRGPGAGVDPEEEDAASTLAAAAAEEI